MSNNLNAFRGSNERQFLINILNTMYNDNLRQINNITDTLNSLNDSNNQIRNLLVQLLNVTQTNNNIPRRSGYSERRHRENDRNNNLNRVYINNIPYIIDSITEHRIPSSSLASSSRNTEINYIGRNSVTAFDVDSILNEFMQPVEVYPTQSQIESATRRVRYCDISRPINAQCPISMEDFNDSDMVTVIRPCGHIFQTEHILNWFRSNCRCPVCRYDIRDYNSNASTEFFNSNIQPNPTRTRSNLSQIDLSNNDVERNPINRIDNIGSNANSNLYFDILSDSYFNNINGYADLSGNLTDTSLLGGSALAMLLLNAMNRSRSSR
jgi:hypothetical protein